MEGSLRCRVSRGMFSGEVAVRGEEADGTEFSLFVPEEFVDCNLPRGESESVEGLIHVVVLAREGNLALVRLPGQAFENGQTVTVRDSELEFRPHHETV